MILRLGGMELTLAEGGRGWTSVHFGEVPLRDPRRPAFAEFRTPDGVILEPVGQATVSQAHDQTMLQWPIQARYERLMEFQLHEVRQRRNLVDWTEDPKPVEGLIQLELRPASRSLRNLELSGFAYRYRFLCPVHPIYCVLDYGTWEPGEDIHGQEFWMRNGTVPSVMRFATPDCFYATGWTLPSIQQPHIFQFLPLQTALQGFTFTIGPSGLLVTWPTEVAHVRSYFEKQRGKGCLFHWHELCGNLSPEFETPWMEVLWHAVEGSLAEWQKANLYESVREAVWDELHRQAGIRQETIGPYGVMEEWQLPDFDAYTDQGLPLLERAGIRTVMVPNECQNNMNEFGVSNMCCTVDLKISESIGRDKFRRFVAEANSKGMEVEMWCNTALSSLTAIFANPDGPQNRISFLPREGSVFDLVWKDPEFLIRNPSGAPEADHYAPVFVCMNLRSLTVREYWNRSLRQIREDYRVGALFFDSSFNLSSDKFHWRQNAFPERTGGATIDQTELHGLHDPSHRFSAAIETQYQAFLDLLRDMQEMGYKLSTEDVGVFGISRSGPDMAVRMQQPYLWLDSYCPFDPPEIGAYQTFFRGLAYKLVWILYWNPQKRVLSWNYEGELGRYEPTEDQLRLLRAFGTVCEAMVRRTILPDEAGVVYDGTGETVVWTFRDTELGSPAGGVYTDVLSGDVTDGPPYHLAAWRVYRIKPQSA